MDFDYQGAIKAGYQPDEIADYLAKKNGFDIAGARNAGYSAPEILQHFGVEVSPKKEGILDRAAKAIDPFISDHVPTATLPEVPRQDDVDSDLAKRNANIESRRQSEGIDQLGTANRYLHSFASGAGAATGSGLNYIGRKFGIKSLEDIGNQMQDVAAARTPSNQSFGEQIASGVGSIVSAIGSAAPVTIALESAPVMAGIAGIAETMPMVARGLNFVAKWAPSAFAGAFEAAGNATQTYDDVLRKTGNKDLAQEQADKTFLANLPVNVALNKFGIFGENGSAVKKIFFSTGSEALQEGTQQAISNYFAANPVGEGVTMNAAAGGAVGGAVKTAGVMLEPNAEAKPSPKPDDILNAPDIDTAITTAAGVVSAPLALPLYAGSPLVVFPDGSTMTRAEAEQRRLDSMVQPAETANAPGGSFGQMDEFATLLSDERADLQKRRSTLPTQDEFDDLLKSEQIDLAYLRRDALDKASAERLAQQSPAPALSLQDEAVAKADALTRAQGFDDPAPTAMQLAMQDALARRRPPTEVPREEIPQATVEAAAAANPVATQPTQPDGPSGLDAGSLPTAVEPVTPAFSIATTERGTLVSGNLESAAPKLREAGISFVPRLMEDGSRVLQISQKDVKTATALLQEKPDATTNAEGPETLEAAPANIPETPAERPVVPEGQGTAGDSDQSTEPLPVKIAASRNPAPIMIRKDIVGAIMRATRGRGIAADMALTITGDSANNVTRLRGLFQRGGVQDMDDIARMVRDEEGFDVKDGAHLEELVRQAAAGDRILSMRGQEEAQSAEEEARHREWLFAQAEKRGIRTRGPRGGLRQFSAVEAEYTALMDKRQATVESKLEERARRAYDAMIEEARSTIGDDRLANELYAAAENLPFDHKARDFYSTVTKHLKGVLDGIQPRDVGLAERSSEGRTGEGEAVGRREADDQRNEEANPPAVPEASAEEGRPALDLVTQTPEELAQKAARENDQAIADRERIKAESEATAPFFSLTQETKPIEVAEQENRARQTGPGLNAKPLEDRHAELDPRVDALSDADAVKVGKELSIEYRRGEDIRAKIKQAHPDDQERALKSIENEATTPSIEGVSISAEQKIRDAFQALPSVSMGKAYPITVEHNGTIKNFMVRQDAIGRGNNKSALHLTEIHRGRMIAGDEMGWIAQGYKLDGKDRLTEEGMPKKLTDEEAEKFNSNFAGTIKTRETDKGVALESRRAGQTVSLRADESGQLKEPAQSGSGAGSNIMLSRKIDAGNTTASKGLQQYRLRVAQQARDKFLSVFKGTDALDIRVVNSRDEIHEDTRPSPYADGVYYDDKGRIYLIADNITDRAHATLILLHEAVGHYGLSTMMGERFQPLKEAALGIHADGDVTNVQPGDKNWATIEAVRRDYPEVSDDVAAQEVLARMAETPGPTPTLLARAMFHVRLWLRDIAEKMGIKWDWKPEEIRNAIGMANDYMRRGDNLPSEGMGGERGLVYSSMSEPIDAAAGPRPAFVANPEHDGQGPERPNASGSRQSIGKLNDEGKPPLESRATTQPASTWDIEPSSPWKDFVYKFQDKYVDLKDAINAIRDSGAMIGDAVNTYLKEELYHKRVGKRTADFFEGEFKPLLITMQAMGVKREEFEEYLHARHATEANALIRDRGGMDDGGSGMTDKDAADYMAKLTPNKRKQYEALAKRTDAILAKTRETLVEYGLESKETIDGWAKMFAHYVPLHREDMAEGQGIGQGFSVKGSASKHRTGSSRNVADILGNIAQQRDRAIVRGEKNRVAVSLFGLAYTNPNPDIWEAGVVPMIQTVDKNNQIVSVPDPMYKSRDNVIVARLKDSNGQVHDRAIVFNESNARALRMAAALKNLDAANLEGLIGLSGKITRFMAAMSTQYNPVFVFINFARDFQSSAINLSSTPLAGKQKEVMGHALSALHGIYADLRDHRAGRTPTSKWEKLYEEMQLEGGTTGYREMFATANDRTAKQIDKLLDPEWWTKTGWGKVVSAGGLLKAPEQFLVSGPGKALVQWLSDANETAENAMRLAVFKTALDHGLSKEQAASLAKNISVNFNRKGQVGAQMNAAYAFFNAATQGTARIYETLKGPAGKQIIVGGLLVGVAQAMMMAAAGFDDDEPKDFIKERNLIIPLGWISGKKDFFSIPMPLGFHVLPSLGRISAEFAMRGFRKPGKAMGDMVSLLAEAFNPIGSAGVSLQTLMPTPLDPLTALAENKDWTGKTIAKEDFNKLSPTPGHSRAKDTATWFGKSISEALNTISGGTKYTPGWMSPTPDQIDYLIGQATGGVGREVMKAEQTISSTVTGEDLPMHKVPLLGRVYGTTEGQSNEASRFYDNLKKLNEHEAEIKGRRENKEDAAGYIRENPESRLVAYANSTERVVSDLRKRKRKLIEDGASKERIKLIEMQMAARMARFNKRVAEVEQ